MHPATENKISQQIKTMTKKDFFQRTLIHLSGEMMNGFSPKVLVQKAFELSNAIDTIEPCYAFELNEMRYLILKAIVEIKKLESDNDYDTRRGSIDTTLELMNKIADYTDRMMVNVDYEKTSLTLFDMAEKEYEEYEEFVKEMSKKFDIEEN